MDDEKGKRTFGVKDFLFILAVIIVTFIITWNILSRFYPKDDAPITLPDRIEESSSGEDVSG